MTQILGFVFAVASTVTALAMLLLVVWQAPRHRHNRLMAVYLATLLFWGASNLAARLCAVLGCDPTVFLYSSVYGNGLNSLVLFWLVTDYVGIGRRRWVRALYGVGLLWLVVGGVTLYGGRVLVDLRITADGLALYRFSSASLPIFLVGHALYLTALGCLWVHRRGSAGALLPGAMVLITGQAATLLMLPFVQGVPPVTIAFTAAASVCFTYAILRESLFNPLARSEASLAAVLENTSDPVWSVDAGGRLTTFNAAFQQLVSGLKGGPAEPGHVAADLFPEDQRLLWRRLHERALTGERVSVERHFEVPGVPERLEGRLYPLAAAGDAPSGVAVFARDVTAHVRVVAAQGRAREAAEDASRAKSQFLASVSHELRTPLNAVLGFAQVLAGRGDGSLTARQAEMAGNILTAGRYLLALIDDLIDLSKIEAGKLDLAADRFAVRERLAAAVHLLAPAAAGKGLEPIFDVADGVPDALVGDPRRLRQVLVNLVGNAVKFTDRGHVLARVVQESETYGGVRLRFDIVDTGVGIGAGQRTRLFEPFVRGRDGTDPGQDGVGLGLAISLRLVEAMGGRLDVESEPGAGSTFSFTLPFMLAPPAAAAPAANLSGTSVLVVDDNDTLRSVLGRWLTGWRVRPTLVADAGAARAALERARLAGTPFDSLLVDAETEGSATLAAAGGARATVVMLPPAREGAVAARPLEHALHIRKPFAPDQLRAALGAALNGAQGDAPTPRARRSARPLRILVAEDSLTNQAIASALLERWGHTVTQAGAPVSTRSRPWWRVPTTWCSWTCRCPAWTGWRRPAASVSARARRPAACRSWP